MNEYECDVLVAGSGAGGLSTAIAASFLGLNVLVVEKESLIGGTTARSGGYLWIPGNSLAKREGIDESGSDIKTYLRSMAGNYFEESRVDAFLSNAPAMIDFFERETQVHFAVGRGFADYHPNRDGAVDEGRSIFALPFLGHKLGKELSRLARPLQETLFLGFAVGSGSELKHFFNATSSVESALFVSRRIAGHFRDLLLHGRDLRLVNGQALAARLLTSALERQIPIWTSTPIRRLIEANGRVVGAEVGTDRPIHVKARLGVVLATGGFPHDLERRTLAYPASVDQNTHTSLAPTGNTGDGVRLAERIGATLSDVSNAAAWAPASRVPRKDGTSGIFPHFIDRAKPGVIAVTSEGKRFVNESNSYHDFVQAMIEVKQDRKAEMFLIADHRAIRKYGLGYVKPYPMPLGEHLRSGYLKSGKSISELAKTAGIDPTGLAETVREFNKHALEGRDPAFGKGTTAYNHFQGDISHQPNPCLAPIEKGPFYAVKIETGDLGTFLGLRTTPYGEVIAAGDRTIPGLYAVGADMGSVFGGGYPGAGATLGPAMTFGYIAAHHLAGKILPMSPDRR